MLDGGTPRVPPRARGFNLPTRGSFPVAQHGGTIQSSSGLYIIVKGVSH